MEPQINVTQNLCCFTCKFTRSSNYELADLNCQMAIFLLTGNFRKKLSVKCTEVDTGYNGAYDLQQRQFLEQIKWPE